MPLALLTFWRLLPIQTQLTLPCHQLELVRLMYSIRWQIIRDDSKRTFEVCGQASNTNPFTNQIVAWQRAGMNVSFATPPVTNKNSSKGLVKVTGYTQEDGLQQRLLEQFRQILRGEMDDETF